MSKKEKNNNLQDLDLFLKNKINGSEFLARLLNNNNFEMLFTIFEKEAYLDPEKDSITPLEYDIYKALYFLKIEDYHRSNKYFHKCLDTHPLNEICHEYLSKIPKEINKKIFKIKLVGDINTTNNIFLNLVKSLVKIDTIELSIDTEITSYHKVPFLNSIRKAKSDVLASTLSWNLTTVQHFLPCQGQKCCTDALFRSKTFKSFGVAAIFEGRPRPNAAFLGPKCRKARQYSILAKVPLSG